MRLFKGVAFVVAALLVGCSHPGPLAPQGILDPALDRLIILEAFDHDLLSRPTFHETKKARVANAVRPLIGRTGLDHAADMQANYIALTLTVRHSSMFPP